MAEHIVAIWNDDRPIPKYQTFLNWGWRLLAVEPSESRCRLVGRFVRDGAAYRVYTYFGESGVADETIRLRMPLVHQQIQAGYTFLAPKNLRGMK